MVKPHPRASLAYVRPPRLAYGCRSCCLVEAYGGTHARQLVSIVSHYDHTLGQHLPEGVVIMANHRGRALPMPRHDTPPIFHDFLSSSSLLNNIKP